MRQKPSSNITQVCFKTISFSILFVILMMLNSFLIISVSATEGGTYLQFNDTFTNNIDEISLPWPLEGYKIGLDLSGSMDTTIPIEFSSDKSQISPGEDLTFTINTQRTDSEGGFHVTLYVLHNSEKVQQVNVPIPLPDPGVPEKLITSPIPIPVIPLEIVGIPFEISIMLKLSFENSLILTLETYGLSPVNYEVAFTTEQLYQSLSFHKPSGVGGEIYIKNSKVNYSINLNVGLGLTILYVLPIPLTFPLGDFALTEPIFSSQQNIELLLLKSPIDLSLSSSKESVNVEESVTFSGQISPITSDIDIELQIRKEGEVWTNIDTTTTDNNGEFSYIWNPQEPGSYEIRVYHSGSKYTIEGYSNTISLSVTGISIPALINLITLVLIVIIVTIIIYKIMKRR